MPLNIAVIESSLFTLNHYLVVSLVRALRATTEVDNVVLLDLPSALYQSRSQTFDVLIVFGGEQADNTIIQELCRRARVSMVWYTEDPYEFERNKATCHQFDIVLTNDQHCAALYGEKGHHFPLAAESLYAQRFIEWDARRYDLSFVGTLWPNRGHFFEEAAETIGRFKSRLEIVDNEHARRSIDGGFSAFPLGSGVDYLDFMSICEQSRLSLMIDRAFSGSGRNTVSDTPGPRFFEAGVTGACVLVDRRVAGKLAELGLVDGETYLGFSDTAEFVSLMAEYRNDRARFERIGRALQLEIQRAHTYEIRAKHLMDLALIRLAQSRDGHGSAAVLSENSKPRILVLTHNLSVFGTFGGSELYLEHLMRGQPQYDWYVLAHNASADFGSTYVLFGPDGRVLSEVSPAPHFSDMMLKHEELEQFFVQACATSRPNILLVNHLVVFPPTLPMLANTLGIPYLVILHDYYMVCDQFNLLMHNHLHCYVREPDSALCDLCTYKRRSVRQGSQFRRRTAYRQVLANAAAAITNTASAARLVEDISGVTLPQISVVPPPRLNRVPRFERAAVAVRNVAIVGNISNNKGLGDLIEIAQGTTDRNLTFHVFGRHDAALEDRISELAITNIRLHGPYRDGLPAAVAECDVALFLSRWPETYCMTLTEVMDAGVVPIAYRLGALAERISDEIGFIVEPFPGAISKLLKELEADAAPVLERAARLRSKTPEPDTFLASYRDILDKHIALSRPLQTDSVHLTSKTLLLEWWPRQWHADDPVALQLEPPADKKQFGVTLLKSALSTLKRDGLRPTLRRVCEWLLAR